MSKTITINRAPVLTLWAAVVAERLGHDRATALSLGKALAGLNAQSKGRMLGIYGPGKAKAKEGAETTSAGAPPAVSWVELMGRSVPARSTPSGLRALKGEEIVDPEATVRYLDKSFGERVLEVRHAMEGLAGSLDASALDAEAYGLFERFRPKIPPGRAGWGAKGELDLELLRSLARGR